MYSRLVIATLNDGKVREFQSLLRLAGLPLVPATEAGIREFPDEEGETFAANALAKAIFATRKTRQPAIADDSGIVIDALDGAPGVRSARFGQPGWGDFERNQLILEVMSDVPAEKRTARFVAAVAVVAPNGVMRQTTGTLEGHIAMRPQGQNGFGYDAIFVPLDEERTFAQMTAEEKNTISHRAQAIGAMRPHLLALMSNRWEQ